MFPEDALFSVAAIAVLETLTVIGVLAVLCSWDATRSKHEEDLQTTGDPYLSLTWICFIAGCVTILVCVLLGLFYPTSPLVHSDFWQVHQVALKMLFIPIDIVFGISVLFALEFAGRGSRTLVISTSIMAVASILGTILLWI